MDGNLSIGLFNTQADQWETLKGVINQVNALTLALETENWEQLEAALSEGELDAVMVYLEEDGEHGKQIVQQIVQAVPDMSVIGVSTRTDPAMIISAMRAGCSQFVCAPIDLEDFRNAVARMYDISELEPDIQVKDVDLLGDRHLHLHHEMRNKIPLDEVNRAAVLEHVRRLWGYDANADAA